MRVIFTLLLVFLSVCMPVSHSYGTGEEQNPTGAILLFGGTHAPDGYLLCNGQAVSRTTYAGLLAVIGIAYGGGDGINTFNVPDLRGRMPVGFVGGDVAGRITTATTQNAASPALGVTGGDERHQLTTNEMPTHNHNYSETYTNRNDWASGAPVMFSQYQRDAATSSVGGNAPHNNMPPFQFCSFIIKY